MSDSSPSLLDRARTPTAKKAIKYAAVSLVGVVTTQVLLLVFLEILDINPTESNVIAVMISSIPAYLLNRYWVWGKRGKNQFMREVVPFWSFAIAGLLLSTFLVAQVEEHTDNFFAVSAANLTGFGLLWVARYFVLDRLLFKQTHEGESLLEVLAEDAPLA